MVTSHREVGSVHWVQYRAWGEGSNPKCAEGWQPLIPEDLLLRIITIFSFYSHLLYTPLTYNTLKHYFLPAPHTHDDLEHCATWCIIDFPLH